MVMAAGQRYPAEARLQNAAFDAQHVLKHSSRHTRIPQILHGISQPCNCLLFINTA